MNQHESNNKFEFSIVDGDPPDRGLNRAGLNKTWREVSRFASGRTGGDLLATAADFVS